MRPRCRAVCPPVAFLAVLLGGVVASCVYDWDQRIAGTGHGASGGGEAGTGTALNGGGGAGTGTPAGGGGGGGVPCVDSCPPSNDPCLYVEGTCNPETELCEYAPRPDDTVCGSEPCNAAWGECSHDPPCQEEGTRSRSCPVYRCAGGVCTARDEPELEGCSELVADGTTCGSGLYCCGNSCVARNSREHCGVCGIVCPGAFECEEVESSPGQYMCACSENADCNDAGYGGAVSCFTYPSTVGQRLCNCRPWNEEGYGDSWVDLPGKCDGSQTALCRNSPNGHNYCHY